VITSGARKKLAQSITGQVLSAADPAYATVVQLDNGRVRMAPPTVVMAASVKDVITTVNFAREEGTRLTVRGGGHGAAGYCLNGDGIVLDMRLLNSLDLDRERGKLRVGMGARWKQVYDFVETSRTGLLPVGGGCAGVGVAGFLLGGGYSFASRTYGLGADNLESLVIVTADGEKRVLDKAAAKDSIEQDLFWACCGGGGGNFGVAVEGTLQLRKPKDANFLVGQIQFPFYRIDEVLAYYNEWVSRKSFPREMAIYGFLGMQPNPRNANQPVLSLRFTPVYTGAYAEGVKLLEPLLKMSPTNTSLYRMTMPEWEDFIGTGTVVNGRSAYMRSTVLPALSLNKEVVRVFRYYMSRCPSPETFMVWTHTGGAIAEIPEDATAFPHRKTLFTPEIKSIWDINRPQEARANIEWAYDFFEALADKGKSSGAYLNYIDPLLTRWKDQYYGLNFARLKSIKDRVDSGHVFRFQQSVDSAYEPIGTKPLDLSVLQCS
jgi:hypothetical protein